MLQKPKGTYDVYGKTGKQIKYIEKLLNALMDKYNYEYFKTPLFEASELLSNLLNWLIRFVLTKPIPHKPWNLFLIRKS